MLTNMHLADAYAAAKAELDALKTKVEKLREELIKTGCDAVHGDFSTVKINLTERANFDSKMAKAFLTAEQIAACTGKSDVYTLTVKPRLPVAA